MVLRVKELHRRAAAGVHRLAHPGRARRVKGTGQQVGLVVDLGAATGQPKRALAAAQRKEITARYAIEGGHGTRNHAVGVGQPPEELIVLGRQGRQGQPQEL